jgi:hypothetical protein
MTSSTASRMEEGKGGRLTFGEGLGRRPAVYERPEYGHCTSSGSLVEECYGDKELPWVVRDAFYSECKYKVKSVGKENARDERDIPWMRMGLAFRRRS